MHYDPSDYFESDAYYTALDIVAFWAGPPRTSCSCWYDDAKAAYDHQAANGWREFEDVISELVDDGLIAREGIRGERLRVTQYAVDEHRAGEDLEAHLVAQQPPVSN